MTTLVIYDVVKKESAWEKAFGVIPLPVKRETRSFSIQHPDGKEENISYSVIDLDSVYRHLHPSHAERALHRSKELQKIINRLESEGYKVRQDQLALLMSERINKLILSKV